jgi:hypothetical protein
VETPARGQHLEEINDIASRQRVGDSSATNSNVQATGSKRVAPLKYESDTELRQADLQAGAGEIVIDNLATSIPVTARELDVIEMHLQSMLDQILTRDRESTPDRTKIDIDDCNSRVPRK